MSIEFELTPKMQKAREMAHMFAANCVRPYALEADKLEGPHPKFIEACKQFGLGTGSSGALTGGGGSKERFDKPASGEKKVSEANRIMLLASEELAWADASAALNMPGPGLGGPPIQFTGTPEQKERFLGMFKPDEYKFGAYALTEPGAGSDAKNIRTSCRRDGNHWVLNGSKMYITNGKKAEWSVVFATIDPALGRAGHRAFVVERGTPGFSCPKVEKKMGLKASETAEQVFEDCRVPAENLLGGDAQYERAGSEGFKTAMKTFDATRPVVAIMAVGIARSAFEIARDWVRENYALSQHTARYHRLAEALAWMEREIHTARLLSWKAAWMLDMGLPNAKESSESKAYAGTMVQQVTAKAIEILGPEGVLHNRLVEKLYRDQKVYDIFEGTGQIQRVVISRRLFSA